MNLLVLLSYYDNHLLSLSRSLMYSRYSVEFSEAQCPLQVGISQILLNFHQKLKFVFHFAPCFK
jgi:hypothetical protein